MHPSVNGWPPGTETTRPTPRGRWRAAPGDRGGATGSCSPPPPPRLPRPAESQRPTRGAAALHPP